MILLFAMMTNIFLLTKFSFPKRSILFLPLNKSILIVPIRVYLWVISEYFIPCSGYSIVNNEVISHEIKQLCVHNLILSDKIVK